MHDDEVESETLIHAKSSVHGSRKSSTSVLWMFKYLFCALFSTVIIILLLQKSVERSEVTTLPMASEAIYPPKSLMDHLASNSSQVDQVFERMSQVWSKFSPVCRVPSNLKAGDALVMLWDQDDQFSCPLEEPFTQLDESTGRLSLRPQFKNHSTIKCYYSHMSRLEYDENYILYDQVLPLTSDIFLSNVKSTVNVSCHKNSTVIYQNTHLYIDTYKFTRRGDCPEDECRYEEQSFEDESNRPIIQSHDPVKPSVLIIFLESLSQLSFERWMVKTKASLESLGNVIQFKYFVKPLDNSFPNTMAMLTGERIDWPRETTLKADYFDNKFKYLWDYYHASGYVTGFMEDLAPISVFKYGKWGFRKQPVDFYPRPFWLQMYPNLSIFDINESMSLKKHFCFAQNGKKVKLFLDQITQFVKKQTDPSFLFAFYSQMTHTDLHSYKWVDADFANFFASLKDYLNNTILVFAGDHGFRMSGYTATSLGRVEERMNLVTVRIPDALDERYPHLRKFLNINSDRLTTWFDMHLMLRQFATGEYKLYPSLDSFGSLDVATNPARQFTHPLRTCPHASILPEYCVCNQFVSVSTHGPLHDKDVLPASGSLASIVNDLLQSKYLNCDIQSHNVTKVFKYYISPETESQMIARAYVEVVLYPSKESVSSFLTRDQGVADEWSLDAEMNSRFGISLENSLNIGAFGCETTSPKSRRFMRTMRRDG